MVACKSLFVLVRRSNSIDLSSVGPLRPLKIGIDSVHFLVHSINFLIESTVICLELVVDPCEPLDLSESFAFRAATHLGHSVLLRQSVDILIESGYGCLQIAICPC
jgi:hypothetical protein